MAKKSKKKPNFIDLNRWTQNLLQSVHDLLADGPISWQEPGGCHLKNDNNSFYSWKTQYIMKVNINNKDGKACQDGREQVKNQEFTVQLMFTSITDDQALSMHGRPYFLHFIWHFQPNAFIMVILTFNKSSRKTILKILLLFSKDSNHRCPLLDCPMTLTLMEVKASNLCTRKGI